MTPEENWQLVYQVERERRWLGYSDRERPYADCICASCRSPVGWNRCARDVSPYSYFPEHQAEVRRSFEGMAL